VTAHLHVDGEAVSYSTLSERAHSLAATLAALTPAGGPTLTAVFAYRTSTAYAGVLGALLAGTGYVPLNRKFPPQRTRLMLERSGCRAVIVDRESAEQLSEVIDGVDYELLLVLPDHEGHDVRLGDLWNDRPVALVWLRHYG
jgi:acyl-CoA synthetase (AMP-forming)/AMP-acid ligase II